MEEAATLNSALGANPSETDEAAMVAASYG
jgi:hypothetical protein